MRGVRCCSFVFIWAPACALVTLVHRKVRGEEEGDWLGTVLVPLWVLVGTSLLSWWLYLGNVHVARHGGEGTAATADRFLGVHLGFTVVATLIMWGSRATPLWLESEHAARGSLWTALTIAEPVMAALLMFAFMFGYDAAWAVCSDARGVARRLRARRAEAKEWWRRRSLARFGKPSGEN